MNIKAFYLILAASGLSYLSQTVEAHSGGHMFALLVPVDLMMVS